MKLLRAELTNVRKFAHLTLNFTDGNNEIKKNNRWGKTTVADAIMFVLTGKLNDGTSDISSLKPINNTRAQVVVELVFATEWTGDDQPKELRFKKEYGEEWVKTRGSTEEELKGHYTNFYINDTKKTATEYQKELLKFFNADDMKYIQIVTNPVHFSQNITWQERSEIIMKIIGAIQFNEVAEKNQAVQLIKTDLQNAMFNIDAAKKTVMNKLTGQGSDRGLKGKAHDLEAQIKGYAATDTVSQSTFDDATVKFSSNLTTISLLKTKKNGIHNPILDDLKAQRLTAEANVNTSELNDQAEINRKNRSVDETVNKLEKDINDKKMEISKIGLDVKIQENFIKTADKEVLENNILIKAKNAKRQELRERWNDTIASVYEPMESVVCPECGFDLSAESNASGVEHFNLEKGRKLESISTDGKQLKADVESLEKTNESKRAQIEEAHTKISGLNADIEFVNDEIETLESEKQTALKKKLYSYVSEETKHFRERVQAIKDNITAEENAALDTTAIDNDIAKVEEENRELQKTIALFNQQDLDRKRIEKWQIELGLVNKDIADNEVKLDLLREYRRIKLEIMRERLQLVFGDIEFKLVEENIKADSWNEVCYVMDGLVPYERTNTESKIKIGIKIIEAIKNALGIENMPIVMDNAEAMTESNRRFETHAQSVCLIAEERE